MNIEHCDFFHGFAKGAKRKNHEQDGETLIAREISVRRSCHGLRMAPS
jgi:hypothetical protein